jgi:hypothetical protein
MSGCAYDWNVSAGESIPPKTGRRESAKKVP